MLIPHFFLKHDHSRLAHCNHGCEQSLVIAFWISFLGYHCLERFRRGQKPVSSGGSLPSFFVCLFVWGGIFWGGEGV